MAIGPYAKIIGKWGIPGKNFKNVAQQCYLDGCSAFLPDFIAKKRFLAIFPLKFPLKSKKFTDSGRNGRRTKTKTVLKSVNKMEHFETM